PFALLLGPLPPPQGGFPGNPYVERPSSAVGEQVLVREFPDDLTRVIADEQEARGEIVETVADRARQAFIGEVVDQGRQRIKALLHELPVRGIFRVIQGPRLRNLYDGIDERLGTSGLRPAGLQRVV